MEHGTCFLPAMKNILFGWIWGLGFRVCFGFSEFCGAEWYSRDSGPTLYLLFRTYALVNDRGLGFMA